MAVITARVNDKSKAEAEKIANKIGLPLSSVINIFLNRFIAEKGFPFEVTVPEEKKTYFNISELEEMVRKAIEAENSSDMPKSAYLDLSDNTIKHT